MSAELGLLLMPAILLVAALYASIGHAGGSGYMAVLALAGFGPDVLKPTALLLNVLVAAIGTWQFSRAGHFRWRLFWPFALAAVPASFVGGSWTLVAGVFERLVGVILLAAAVHLLLRARPRDGDGAAPPPVAIALPVGAGLGVLAGATGIGGGVLLMPLLLYAKWASPETAAGVSAPFILASSLGGLAGHLDAGHELPTLALTLLPAAALGGFLGSRYGSRRFAGSTIRRVLALVLAVAGAKLIFGV